MMRAEDRIIVLLDLNYTLVANSQQKKRPFPKQIEGEQYRTWLLKMLGPDHHVVLVTARPIRHKAATLASLLEKEGWRPAAAYFNDSKLPPASFKERVVQYLLKERYLQQWIDAGRVVAIESNPRTRKMYATYGIPCMQISEDKDGNTV